MRCQLCRDIPLRAATVACLSWRFDVAPEAKGLHSVHNQTKLYQPAASVMAPAGAEDCCAEFRGQYPALLQAID